MDKACIAKQPQGLSVFGKYLTAWVLLCITVVLIEVPVMLMLVRICLRTRGRFSHGR